MSTFKPLIFSEKKISKTTRDVMYHNQTEEPFSNPYWNFWGHGLYVDPTNGEPLFSCYDKVTSICGWPAFCKPIKPDAVTYVHDSSHNMSREEVRTTRSQLHLGHVFDDFEPLALARGYRRYCINSAAVKFVSQAEILNSDNEVLKTVWKSQASVNKKDLVLIVLAGGCFWGIQHLMRQIFGVYATVAGYANYKTATPPTYRQVCSGKTQAVEAVQILFNQKLVSLERILEVFFANIDPHLSNQQGNDVGTQYRTGVYYTDLRDLLGIKAYFENNVLNSQKTVFTELLPLKTFSPAEEEHQDYLVKNPGGYCHIQYKKLY